MIDFRACLFVLASLCLAMATAREPASRPKPAVEVPPLNRKVVDFARSRIGEKVGDGQCTALASSALREAGAKSYSFRGVGGDYIWGREIPGFRESMPGDIVQFRDAVFRGKRWLTRTRWVSWNQSYPHHTAIIAEVRERGSVVTLLHQNVGPADLDDDRKQVVSETTLRTASLQKGGRVWIYRPVPLEDESDAFEAGRSGEE